LNKILIVNTNIKNKITTNGNSHCVVVTLSASFIKYIGIFLEKSSTLSFGDNSLNPNSFDNVLGKKSDPITAVPKSVYMRYFACFGEQYAMAAKTPNT
jgi:hypothetical protein